MAFQKVACMFHQMARWIYGAWIEINILCSLRGPDHIRADVTSGKEPTISEPIGKAIFGKSKCISESKTRQSIFLNSTSLQRSLSWHAIEYGKSGTRGGEEKSNLFSKIYGGFEIDLSCSRSSWPNKVIYSLSGITNMRPNSSTVQFHCFIMLLIVLLVVTMVYRSGWLNIWLVYIWLWLQ